MASSFHCEYLHVGFTVRLSAPVVYFSSVLKNGQTRSINSTLPVCGKALLSPPCQWSYTQTEPTILWWHIAQWWVAVICTSMHHKTTSFNGATKNTGLQENTGPGNAGQNVSRFLAVNLCVLYRVLITVCFNVCFPLFVYSFNVVNNYVFFFPPFVFCLAATRCNKVCIKTPENDQCH